MTGRLALRVVIQLKATTRYKHTFSSNQTCGYSRCDCIVQKSKDNFVLLCRNLRDGCATTQKGVLVVFVTSDSDFLRDVNAVIECRTSELT